MMTQVGSIWLEHPDYPGYRFSPEGAALSLIGKTPKLMRFKPDTRGYVMGSFQKSGVKTRALIHRLIAQIYCPGFAPGLQVNHKNGKKGDNRAENLEWVTSKENHAHAKHVLKRRFARGVDHSDLTEEQVRNIYVLRFERRMTNHTIAAETGIPKSTITGVVTGRTWAHLYSDWAGHRPRKRFSTKLSPNDVRMIRLDADPKKRNYPGIAKKYGISVATVSLIYNRKIYDDII